MIIDTTKLPKRILNAVGLITKSDADVKADRAFEAGYNSSIEDEPPSGTLKTYGYRRSTAGTLRDFTKIPYDKIIRTVWVLFQNNPVVKRTNKIKTSHFLGGGVEYQTDDDDVKETLDTNWRVNKINRKLRKWVFELRLWGEQIYPVFVRQADGQVRLGYIDSEQIGMIKTHPDNSMERWAIVLKSDAANRRKVYRVVREDESFIDAMNQVRPAQNEGLMVTAEQANIQDWEKAFLKECGLTEYTGSCLLFQVNNMSNQSRGFSDYLQSSDWLDALDETLFAVGEREQFANYFSWDFTLEGYDDAKVSEFAKKDKKNPPKRGSAHYHNEKVTRELKYPDLKQMGSIETVKAILTFVLGGLGFPLHWFGFGDDANRATATTMGDPTWKTLEEEQDEVREMILDILTFFRDQAIIAGYLEPAAFEADISVTMPEMTKKDLTQLSAAMNQTATSLMVAEQNGWSTREQIVTVWQKFMQELGVDAVTLEDIDAEQPEEMETANKVNEWLAKRINGNS